MAQNCVDVNISFVGLPLNDTDEHQALKDRIFDAGCNVSEFIQENNNACCYMPDKNYDARLLMTQIELLNSVLEQQHETEHLIQQSVPVSDINFDVYRDLSDICKNVDVHVVVSKFGPHVFVTDDYIKPEYYNKIITSVRSGEFLNQVACHRELDKNGVEFRREGDMRLVLNGNECKPTMLDIYNELDVRLQSFYKNELQQNNQASIEEKHSSDRVVDLIESVSEHDGHDDFLI